MAERNVVVQAAPVVDFVVPCRAEREPDGVRCTGEVRYAPGAVQAACTACGAWRGRYAPAEPGPLVFALPPVPDSVTRLRYVGKSDGPQPRHAERTAGGDWLAGGRLVDLAGLFAMSRDGQLIDDTPKPEPRTWPKLDAISTDLKTVRGASGKVYHQSHFSQSVPVFRERGEDGDELTGPGHMFYALQTFDGPLTEVLDA